MTIIRYIRSDWSTHITVSTRYRDGMGNTISYTDEVDAIVKNNHYKTQDEVVKISFYYPFNFIGPLPPNG